MVSLATACNTIRPPCGCPESARSDSIEFNKCLANELYPPVSPGQGIENFAVKHKGAVHLLALGQCAIQGRLIVCAQIAAEPD